jgi:hypothetical protein
VKNFSIIGFGLVASLMMMATGCDSAGQGSATPKQEQPEQQGVAPLVLDGVFLQDDGEDEIELRDSEHRYRLLVDGCSSEDCEEQGSFELGVNELHLTVDGSGSRYSIPIAIEDAEDVEPQEEVTAADEAPPSTDVAFEQAGNVRTQELVKQPDQLVKRNVRLVRQVKIRNGKYTKQAAGSCSATQIRQAQTYCRDVKCAGRRSRGINFCASKGGKSSFSCACSGGGGGGLVGSAGGQLVNNACGRCQQTYRRCRANQIACPKMADCLGDFYNCSDAISNCSTPRVQDFCTGWRP